MEKTYITFGQVHAHAFMGKTFDRNCVGVISCQNEEHGRELAFKYFKGKFHNQYHEEQWNDDLLKWFPRGLINVNF